MRASWPQRILLAVLAAVAGGVFGIAGTIAHSFTLGVLPVGLMLALIGCAALLIGLRLLFPHRWIAWIGGLGMLAAVLVYSGQGPGGSVVVPQPAEGEFPLGIVWTYAVTGVVLLVGAWPDLSRLRMSPRPDAGEPGASGDHPARARRIDP
ncbi:histidinol dehydrogenase [Microbacterium sp.]|uniref:histidinol dehydrogenase n=1 Tax=Microbacterium sp. TaxID=51671 RepID=UPI0028118978|nr:histidinol dehydrogenase [Microbacterium sp.]